METIDKIEVDRFRAIASEWWDPAGKFRPLHDINPVRLEFLRDQIAAHFDRDPRVAKPFAGLSFLDVGCGGGLIAEPLARLGASVTGIDPGEENITVAREHAEAQGLEIEYIVGTSDDLVAAGRTFDCVNALEVLEHVPDMTVFLKGCTPLVASGGLFLTSTISRTFKSFALAIVAAEYILGWVPRGTHDWNRFATPAELRGMLRDSGLEPLAERGMVYNPLKGVWALSDDCDVNYLASAVKPAL